MYESFIPSPCVSASVAQPVFQDVSAASRLTFPPFDVGRGIPPVVSKLVGSIVTAQFVDLASLVAEPTEPDSLVFTLLEDQLVLRQPKEAINIFVLVLTAHQPYRNSDLLR